MRWWIVGVLLMAAPAMAAETVQERDARAIEAAARNEVPVYSRGRFSWSAKKPAGWSRVNAMQVQGCTLDLLNTTTGETPVVFPEYRVTLDLGRVTIPDPDPDGDGWFNWLDHDAEDRDATMYINLAENYRPEPEGTGARFVARLIALGAVTYRMENVDTLAPMQTLARMLIDYRDTYCRPTG